MPTPAPAPAATPPASPPTPNLDSSIAGGGNQDTPPAGGFDWNSPLPSTLPDAISSLKGKTFQDLVASYTSLRTTLNDKGTRASQLEQELATSRQAAQEWQQKAEAASNPEAAERLRAQAQVQLQQFYAARDQYVDTGEVDEAFINKIGEVGVRVDRDTILRFLEFSRFEFNNAIQNLTKHAGGQMSEEQVAGAMQWLKSGKSPFSPAARQGFDELYRAGNYSWFDTVAQEYVKVFGNGSFKAGSSGKMIRGKPIQTPETGVFKDSGDFQNQLMAIRRDKTLTLGQKKAKERELIAARRAQHGDE